MILKISTEESHDTKLTLGLNLVQRKELLQWQLYLKLRLFQNNSSHIHTGFDDYNENNEDALC